MANCNSCGRELPAFTTGPLSTLCRECQATVNSAPPLTSVIRSGNRSSSISLTQILVGVNVAVFVLMTATGVSFISPTSGQLLKWGANWGPLSLTTQPWRVLTSNYVHIGIIHIGFNMWCLLNLGALAQRIFDRWTYLLIYTATGIGGSIASLAWHPSVVGAGASGAIFGLAGALIAALYLGKLPIPKEAIRSTMKSLLLFAAYKLFFGLTRGIDNAAHIGGLVSGLALGTFLSRHLTEPAELRQQWRNYALILSVLLIGVSLYYVRHQHQELADIAHPSEYIDEYGKVMDAFRRKDYAGAVVPGQKLVQSNPKSAESHYLLGVAYATTQNPEGAILEFQAALRLNPKYSEAAAALAEVYKSKGMQP